jgi:outer membrane lipoprotein carrier protein
MNARQIIITTLLAVLCLAPCAEGERFSLEEVIAHVQEKYDRTQDLEARFVQKAVISSMNQTIIEEGPVYFKKPRRMLWDYTAPSEKKLVINPEKAWLYMPEDNLAYIQDTEKLFSSKMTIRFLAGIGKLKEDFHIAFHPEHQVDEKGNYRLCLTPRTGDMGIDKLFMTIDKGSFLVMSFSFTDIVGNTTALAFTNMKTNTGLTDSTFLFTPPPGVEIFEVP